MQNKFVEIRKIARELPHSPGVYLMKDRLGSVIYVGKLVWINEANFLNLGKTGASQGTKDALESFKSFLENLGETKLIFSACPIHRNHSFVKWLQKNASYEDVTKNEKEDVTFRRVVQEAAEKSGVSFESGAIECLAGKIGAHPRLGAEETAKLSTYLGPDGGKITEDMIMEMVPDFGELPEGDAHPCLEKNVFQWIP